MFNRAPLRALACVAAITVSGCAAHSSNLRVGNESSLTSLSDQRDAMRAVGEFATLPSNAETIGTVDAGRCHRSFAQSAPTRENVVADLKVAAYAKGADGITTIVIEKKSGLSDNCWYVLNGTALAFRLPQKQ
jgi:hypothetical protein